ncbi:MAG: hypothetical protein ACE5J2_02250 [Nitrososphaerales archaeon]
MLGGENTKKFTRLSAITTGLEAVATILGAVKIITVSIKSLASISQSGNGSQPNNIGSGLAMHKWVLLAGAVVALITIAYLENILLNSKPKPIAVNKKAKEEKAKEEKAKQEERFESVYVTS